MRYLIKLKQDLSRILVEYNQVGKMLKRLSQQFRDPRQRMEPASESLREAARQRIFSLAREQPTE